MKVRHREERSPSRYFGRVTTWQGDVVDVDTETGEYLLSTGHFERVGDGDDDGAADTCNTVMSDGEVCGRELPCRYHSED